jgi:hypothetical protein
VNGRDFEGGIPLCQKDVAFPPIADQGVDQLLFARVDLVG